MKKKLSIKLNHYIFILSLILISCVGVGFSGWIIEGGNNTSGKGDVNINVGEVNDLSNLIQINYSQITSFKYTKDGIVDTTNDMVGMQGKIAIPFILHDLDKMYNKIDSLNSSGMLILNVIFSFYDSQDKSFDFVKYIDSSSFGFKESISASFAYNTCDMNKNNGSVQTIFTLTNLKKTSKRYYGQLLYSFSFIKDDWTSIYKHFNNHNMFIKLDFMVGN